MEYIKTFVSWENQKGKKSPKKKKKNVRPINLREICSQESNKVKVVSFFLIKKIIKCL